MNLLSRDQNNNKSFKNPSLKFLKLLVYAVLYILTIHISLSLFSTFAAYNNLKQEYANEIKKQDESIKINQPIVFVGSNHEVVNTLFGTVNVSFPPHCYSSADSYFNANVSGTKFVSVFFSIIVSLFLIAIFRAKKVPLNLLSTLISALLVAIIAFFAVQLWLNSSSNIKEYSLRSFSAPCF